MKKIFNNPEIEIMILGVQDIITTSVATGDPANEQEDGAEAGAAW